jgi:hypothetical protein
MDVKGDFIASIDIYRHLDQVCPGSLNIKNLWPIHYLMLVTTAMLCSSNVAVSKPRSTPELIFT